MASSLGVALGKPDPQVFLEGAWLPGTDPARTNYCLGDEPVMDAPAAREAGRTGVGLETGRGGAAVRAMRALRCLMAVRLTCRIRSPCARRAPW